MEGSLEIANALPATREASLARTAARHALLLAGLFVVLSVVYWAIVFWVGGAAGMPLDDSFIHLQYARTIHEGHPFQYNPGEVSNGTSAPLWTAMLPLAYRLTGDWLMAAYALGVVWTIPCVALTYWLVLRWTGKTAWALLGAVLLVMTHPTVVSAYEGMEVPAYVAVFLLGLLFYDFSRTAAPDCQRRWRLVGSALFAVSVWLRPEFLLMAPIIAGERALTMRRQGPGWQRPWLAEMVLHGATWLLFLSPYLAFNLWASGTLLPNTYTIKAVARNATRDVEFLAGLPYAIRMRDPWALLRCLTICQLLVIWSLVFGLLLNNAILTWKLPATLRHAWRGALGPAGILAGISVLAFPLVRGLIDPNGLFPFQYQRYFGQITALVIVLVLALLASRMALPSRRLIVLAAVACAPASLFFGAQAVKAVDNINDMQVHIGHWLEQNTPKDAVIATNDVGAIAFYADRRIVDTVGLCEPKLARHYMGGGTLEQYLEKVRPTYACLFPDWHVVDHHETDKAGKVQPVSIGIARRTDLFQRIDKIELDRNVICGGKSMWILLTRWHEDFNPNWIADAEAKAQEKAQRVARRIAAAEAARAKVAAQGSQNDKGQ